MKKWSVLFAGLLLAAALPVSGLAAENGEAEGLPPVSSQPETPEGPDTGGLPGGDGTESLPPDGEGPEEGDGPEPGTPPDGAEDGPDGGAQPPQGRPVLETEEHMVYIEGSGDLVRPLSPLTRAEAAKIVYSLLREPPAGGQGFPDVPAGAWFKDVVESLSAAGLIGGYPDGSFGPQNAISRALFVSIFARCFEPKEAELPFVDVEGHWAREALGTAVSYGWLTGYPDGTVRPDAPITRAEAIAIANRVLGRRGDKAALLAQGMPMRFVDLSAESWAYADIMEAALPHVPQMGEAGEAWAAVTVPQAQRGKGYHLIDGELYCVGDDGYYVRGTQVGFLQFDAYGRYVTGNSQLDASLSQIVRQYTVEGAPAQENLLRLYRYVMDRYSYRGNTLLRDGATGWETQRAVYMLQSGKGNCYDYAALFTMLARRLGYQAQGVSGWIRTSSWDWDRHGWTQIDMGDGRLLLCDPEFQGVYVPNHGLAWDLFMKPYGSTPTQYRTAGHVLG